MRITLLGPQRRPTVAAVAASLPAGPVATVTAGWQEREPDDQELSSLLGGRDVNLALYRRWLDVQDRDPVFAAAERRLQGVLDQAQDIYLLRLDHALQAVYAIQRRSGRRRTGSASPAPGSVGTAALESAALENAALAEAIAAVRDLDAAHHRRVDAIRAEFAQELSDPGRPVIAGHRAEVARLLAGAAALVLTGGHVGVLADVLRLFDVRAGAAARVVAWSAGAMALTETIVLFADRSAHGPGHPEVYGSGAGVLRDLVLLPHARARLLLDDLPRMAVFARRFAPARCILLETGTRIDTDGDGACPPGTRVLAPDGRVISLEAA